MPLWIRWVAVQKLWSLQHTRQLNTCQTLVGRSDEADPLLMRPGLFCIGVPSYFMMTTSQCNCLSCLELCVWQKSIW